MHCFGKNSMILQYLECGFTLYNLVNDCLVLAVLPMKMVAVQTRQVMYLTGTHFQHVSTALWETKWTLSDFDILMLLIGAQW